MHGRITTDSGHTKITTPGDLSVRIMPLSHGQNPTVYRSSAFFIRHDPSAKEFLFFGDVEPDELATERLLVHVWREAASKFPGTMDTMFIECSWPSGRKDEELYGHLTPEHLVNELKSFAAEVMACRTESSGPSKKRQRLENGNTYANVLDGLKVFIIHCKEDLEGKHGRPMREVITDQVRELVLASGLGATVLSAIQGTRIGMSNMKAVCSCRC